MMFCQKIPGKVRLFSTTVSSAVCNGGKEIVLTRGKSAFHVSPLWLREKTLNAEFIHAESNQRLFEISDFVYPAKEGLAKSAEVQGNKLLVEYADGFSDTLDVDVLVNQIENPLKSIYTNKNILPSAAGEKDDYVPLDLNLPERSLWPDDFSLSEITHQFDEVSTSSEALFSCQSALLEYGAVLVKNTPRDIEQYKGLLHKFGQLQKSNWGDWFEVVAKPVVREDGASSFDVAYSSLAIPLHTDGPYNVKPLDYQVLQCLKQSPLGGDSSLSDGFTAGMKLKAQDPEAFDRLTKTMVRFRYYDPSNDLVAEHPFIEVDPRGEIKNIFFSNRHDAAPFSQDVEEFYEARQKFKTLLYEGVVNFKLEENDMLLFSNTRILHGREAFEGHVNPAAKESAQNDVVNGIDLSKYSRYLRGCYCDEVESRFRVMKRSFQSTTRRGYSTCSFAHLKDCTTEDVALMSLNYTDATTGDKLAARAIKLLEQLSDINADMLISDTHLGAKISLLEHGLQTATRVMKADPSNEELIVAALLHDVGELVGPTNHGEFAAALLRPFVSPKVSWMLEHHEIFQMFYYNHKVTPHPRDRNIRERYRDSDFYDFTVDFCEKYDQASFDPDYKSYDLETFIPIVKRVFNREPYWHTPDHPKKGAVTA